jgi:pimeloyl-ACP methyl ester carboxylesterase
MNDILRHRQVDVGDSSLHVVEAGEPGAPPVVFVHGFPTSSASYERMLELAAPHAHALAVDLPGIGDSTGDPTDGTKLAIARKLQGLFAALDLRDVTLVGGDIGGMVVYAYLRHLTGIARAAILHVIVPGVDPYDIGSRDPSMWHFHFNAKPHLPETLVTGRERPFFDHWYDELSGYPERITDADRRTYVSAYTKGNGLRTAFSWYRALGADTAANQDAAGEVTTPLLYLHGDVPAGHPLDPHVAGFLAAGIRNVTAAAVPNSGHLAQVENPGAYWSLVADFAGIRQERRRTA